MRSASFEQRELLGEVIVDGLALHPCPLGYVGNGGLSRTIGPMQLQSCFDDPLARLLVALGSGLQVVLPSFFAAARHFAENPHFLLTACLIIEYHAANWWTYCKFIGGKRISTRKRRETAE